MNEEHRNFNTNAYLIYDFFMQSVLEWPSLSVCWIPPKPDGNENEIYLGTHSEEQNFLFKAQFSGDDADDSKQFKRFPGNITALGIDDPCFEITATIPHTHGEINRIRYMPQNPNIVATINPTSLVQIFNVGLEKRIAVCSGHDPQEGYGLAWNTHRRGRLLSGSHNTRIAIWDVTELSEDVPALFNFNASDKPINDVCWDPHCTSGDTFFSAADDGLVKLWDNRIQPFAASQSLSRFKSPNINAIDVSPLREGIIATCSGSDSSSCEVLLWDMRNPSNPFHELETSDCCFNGISFSPFKNMLSTWSDEEILLWDLSLIGNEAAAVEDDNEEDNDPPELVFRHRGHLYNDRRRLLQTRRSVNHVKINDVCWSADPDLTHCLISVDTDNSLQIWNVNIYEDDDEDDSSEDSAEEETTEADKSKEVIDEEELRRRAEAEFEEEMKDQDDYVKPMEGAVKHHSTGDSDHASKKPRKDDESS